MSSWSQGIAVAVGGAIGASVRYWLGLWIAGWAGTRFPWSTLLINLTGAFALGFLATAVDRWSPSPSSALDGFRFLVLVGLLGGYTTFSTFSLEALRLWHQASALPAIGYMAVSLVGGFGCVALGDGLARTLLSTGG